MKSSFKYFYIDEAGNTGLNLFDDSQAILSYGLISSIENLNLAATKQIQEMRSILGVDRIHGKNIGTYGFRQIEQQIFELHKLLKLNFNVSYVEKVDLAFITFFDQVFDQGMNPAVPWTSYWTPLRYPLMYHLSHCFDLNLLKESWKARIERDNQKSNLTLKPVLSELRKRSSKVHDNRAREIIDGSLEWAENNIEKLRYNPQQGFDPLLIAPNVIALQAVLLRIVELSDTESTPEVTIDRQIQFNKTQKDLLKMYKKGKGNRINLGPGLKPLDLRNFNLNDLSVSASTDCIGLEIVDMYLWLFNRKYLKDDLPKSLDQFMDSLDIHLNYLSFQSILENGETLLREQYKIKITEENKRKALKLLHIQEQSRQRALKKN